MSPKPKDDKRTKSPQRTDDPAWKMVVVLTVVCAIAGVSLAMGHMFSKKPIQKARYRFKLASIKKVLPDCKQDPGANTVQVVLPEVGKTTVYRCRIGGEIVAVAFSLDTKANKNPTYGGPIEVLVGIDTKTDRIFASKEKKRVGVAVLKHAETPGLGAKIEDEDFLRNFCDAQFVGRNLVGEQQSCNAQKQCRTWAVGKDDARGFVDAISGATISSRAMTEVVQRALRYYSKAAIKQKMISAAADER